MKIDREYPRTVPVGEFSVTLRLLGQGDQAAMLALTRSIPERDRLFLRRDVTREDVVERWIEEQERGELATIVAEIDGRFYRSDVTDHKRRYQTTADLLPANHLHVGRFQH